MSRSGPQKLLVVDDDPRLRDLLRRYLTDNGFTVYTAENSAAMNKLWLQSATGASNPPPRMAKLFLCRCMWMSAFDCFRNLLTAATN